MTTDTTPPCANCQRLQAEVDSLRAGLAALRAVVAQLQRQLAAARKDSSNSSKPPSSDIVKPPKPPPPPGQQRRKPGGQPGHTSHQRVPFPPEMLASAPSDYLLDACPGVRRAPARDRRRRAHRRPAGRHRRRAPGDPRAPQPSGLVPLLPEDLSTPRSRFDRARRPGRAAADHPHRLPQGGLPRLVLDHPQVRPRRHRPDHLARAVGQDHRQGEPGPGAALRGVARRPARAGGAQRGRDRAQAQRAAALDLVLPRRAVHAVQDRPDAQRRRADRGAGVGVRRGAGVRLLLGLSPLPSRVRRGAPVLSGASDPRCEVPRRRCPTRGTGRMGRACARRCGISSR